MSGRDQDGAKTRGSGIRILLLATALLLGAASPAQAQDCSDYPDGVLDGFAGTPAPSQLQIDRNCTLRNYPASNPLGTNFSFFTQPGQTDERYLVIFDNVVHTGNMSCNATHEHKIWFTNGSSSKIKQNCQNLLIPVEKIDKRNPAGQTTAAIGVPFTYTLTIPVLFDPATGGVIQTDGSVNDLHSILITDNLNETGADLTYLSHSIYWLDGGAPVPHTFSNAGGLLTFDIDPVIPAGEQIVIEITVVLDDTSANVPGSQFVNTAKWQFGRLIDDVFFEPLPGEWGITEPMTIAAPELVMTKTGPATLGISLNLGEIGNFTLDLLNTGLSDAWDVTILDRLPDGSSGGMCDLTPTVVNAQVFQSDGTTPVSAPLVQGTDYTFSYAGAPSCELTLTMLTAAGVIGPGERLVIDYQTKLDSDSQDGAVLTNVAGATEWFNGDPGNPDRVSFTRVLTDGTPSVEDHEDAHSVTVELDGYFFEKSVANLTSGVSPTTTAAPGDTLRYTLRLQATQLPLGGLSFQDDLGIMNATVVFVPGSLNVVSVPAGADASNTDPNGGTNGAGLLDVRDIDVPAFSDVSVVFDITVDPSVLDGTIILNQADLVSDGSKIADSDDPNINGQADPDVAGDEDPTQVLVAELPVGPLVKAETQATATIGEAFTYQITVPETPYPFDLYDVRITDDLTASAADLRFLGVTKISGSEPWTPVNTGTDTSLVIEDTTIGIDIPAGEQVVVEITVVLEDTPTNVAGLVFTNSASFVFRTIDGDSGSQRPGDQDTSGPMTVVEPDLTMTKSGPPQMTLGIPETFTLDVRNVGDSPAHQLTISDRLPDGATGGMCDAAPTMLTARVFQADGSTPVSGALSEGVDFTTSFAGAPSCLWTLAFTSAQTAIGVGERLILTYETLIDADTQDGTALTNVAGATEWQSTDGANPATAADRRTYTEVITNGTVGVLDHEDAHSVGVALPAYLFEKTAHDPGSGTPITTAAPGDTIRYRLRLENIGEPDFIDLDFSDELDALNAPPAFVPGTLTLVTVPAGADTSGTDPNGGSQGTGLLSIADLTANTGEVVLIEFDITLASTLVGGTLVTNQSQLQLNGALFTVSDDPNVNGTADPFVDGDEDPTQVLITVPAAGGLVKENTQATATIGEAFTYRITVPETPFAYPMYDVRITDDLTTSAANLRFLGVAKISGSEPWTPVNTGTDTAIVIEDTSIGIDIPAGEQIVIEITVVLEDTSPNTDGLTFTNTADYTFDFTDGDDTSRLPGGPGTTPPMTIVEPNLTMAKSGPAQMVVGTPETFTLDVRNTGGSPAYQVTISDRLPDGATGGMCDAAPTVLTARVFQADGSTPVSGALALGVDFSATFAPEPTCLWTLAFTSAQTAIGAGERLILTYETELDLDTQASASLTNVAGATRWFSTDGSDPDTAGDRHTYIEVLTNGTVGTVDHEDAHTVATGLPDYLFEKTVVDPTTGTPITTASPGDTLRYRLRLENSGGTTLFDLGFSDELDRLNSPAAFAPGTLTLVTVPAGGDASGTNPNGGAQGTGVIDVRGLSVAPGGTLLLEFDITLVPVIANGTVVTNQSQLLLGDAPFADSDDPNVNGPADPNVSGDEDPTQVLIQAAPAFRVEKISADITGDPALLLAGETLRYTITVKNIGNANATDATLRDAVPANTQYVPGSTTLNGGPVPDGPSGSSPLANGILIHAPEDPTPGAMRADASATPSNVATIVFDVVVDPDVIDGTVISNQGFVSAPATAVFDQPSDDPRTPIADDPTRDVVGNVPLLFAPKSVSLLIDNGVPGQIDPGDRLRYTITVYNNGSVPATGVVLTDTVPANTTYVDDTTTLNGIPVGQPDGGDAPLESGVPISSSDLTPPLPGPGGGTLTPGQSAVLEFDLDVNAGVPAGTIISNQAVVATAELPDTLTDGDGNPATGPEPTQVVVGDAQRLSITKTVAVVGGGPALPGSTLEYEVRVTNIATVAADAVVITDDLEAATPGQLTYVADSATMNGSAAGVTAVGSLITADYAGTYGPLQPAASVVLRFRATISAAATSGTTITNIGVVTWDDPPRTESASVSIAVGGTPGVGVLSGTVWHDATIDDVQGLNARGEAELVLAGWSVDLYRNGQPLSSTVTDANGSYRIGGVPPNDTNGDAYELRFRAPDAGSGTALLGYAASPFTNGMQRISNIAVTPGSNLENLNLPIDPNGVVYTALERTPIAGATLTLLDAGSGSSLPIGCFDDPAQQGQVTRADGYYKFDLNFSSPSCPSGGSYLIAVVPPGSGFVAGASQLIPPASDASTAPLSVPSCPGTADDAVPATAQYCEAQDTERTPQIGTPGAPYHLHLTLDGSQSPGSSQIFNNHIPVDPEVEGLVSITKTAATLHVSRGELVPYEIIFRNTLAAPLDDLTIVDRFPAGFRYVEGSARVDGVPIEPTQNGLELVWTDLGVDALSQRSLKLLLAVGAGVTEGEFTNRAWATSSTTGDPYSGVATATVRVVPDPTFDCTDVLGKVFDDANRNGVQDGKERGLQGVRVATARGLVATTDQHGRFHITCAVVPREERGSNFVLKLDDRTLPSGYRMTTRQLQVQRATRGKALRFQFGAAIHRVVGLDIADAVFEPGSTEMRLQWQPRIALLVTELEKEPAILRLSYVADVEDAKLVDRRVAAVKQEITGAWKAVDRYPLVIETEIFWRRGGPPDRSTVRPPESASWEALLPSVDAGPPVFDGDAGPAAERHLPIDAPFTQWSRDPALWETQSGDRLETREVVSEEVTTVKLANVVPPIRFESGVADIPVGYVQRLRVVLDGMRHLHNVRLHLVGHADDQALSPALARIYGDNEGLSRERAGEVAEFLQVALALPPESISFGWAGDSQPIASNATAAGRALNRRVEVEVWYDEIEEKLGTEEVVVAEEIKRVKVCRTETVCKLTFREGHARRARVRNLIEPLHFGEESLDVPEEFIRQVEQALHNLRDKHDVTVKFVGFTDDVPLTGRVERIYGTHLSLSKARAHRVALAVQDALRLPTAAVASDGRGATRAIASNDTDRGRALNRRIEVEFWHDDPLQELPDEPQLCPDDAGAEVVTKVYDPPWGRIAPLQLEGGEALIPAGYAEDLRRAMADVAGETHVRLRFVGYTGNERLDRRTALVYGDDIGLSAARARRAMERIQAELALSDAQAEHEGRGYVHSQDVVNAGFLQGETSHVVVEVVYDELAVADDYEGVEVTPITRELRPKDPLALNLMRITVDGEPIDDPGRSLADLQRCTDVALERADIQFRFDNLESVPRLSVTSDPIAVPATPAEAPGARAAAVRFRAYTNYGHFIERAEVRIFERGQSVEAEPLAVVEVGADGLAQWEPSPEWFASPVRELAYVLRAYGDEGRFDETSPQSLWMIHGDPGAPAAPDGAAESDAPAEPGAATPEPGDSSPKDPLLAGYGESGPLARNIPLGNVGSVKVHGNGIPPRHTVWLAGAPVPVDEHGSFVAEVLLPSGMHTVEVAVLDEAGNGELFLRDLEFARSDWFYVGIADLTVATDLSGGPKKALEGADAPYDRDSHADGRVAFYVTGKFGDDWNLTASADTREEPVEDLFSNFTDKSPDSLFRRIDPDYHYPTFGDDGTVEETAPTRGKFYAKLGKNESHALWGNFDAEYLDNELAHVDRGLYGANLHYQTLSTTRFGEQRLAIDGFAADPGTVASREEFRGTGGSLYYLRRQDILQGSDRVRIEVRDKVSGLVTGVVHLRPTLDYDIDWLQGRVLLTEPIASTVADRLLVRSEGLSGDEAWLVVQYEYTPGFDEVDALALGGQGHVWLNDFVKVGVTANDNDNDDGGADSSLYAADVTVRASTESWIKAQAGRSEGLLSTSLRSDDGGFLFQNTADPGLDDAEANAYRADVSIGVSDFIEGAPGRLSLYAQQLEAGYSAPGMTALTDTDQYGGVLDLPVTRRLQLTAKADRREEDAGLETTAGEVNLGYQLTERWSVGTGVRNDRRKDDSPIVPLTQEEGERTDAVVQVGFDARGRWRGYGFGQTTLAKSGDREKNGRLGVGGAYRVSDRLALDGEASHGDLGPAVKLGTSYQESENTHRYLSYALDNERGYDGLHGRRGNLVSGMRSRLSDSSSVYLEDRYQHGDSATGLARAMGINLAPTDRWSLGANWELGTLIDERTHAETKRRAGGARVAYGFEGLHLSTGVEYRFDETEQIDRTWTDRTTWLFRNNLRYQMTPSARVLGKVNHSFSDSSLGQFFDGGYTEAVLGYAYRPVQHDRLHTLFKYTYFYNMPATDQITLVGTPVEFVQKSHVAAVDVTYDLTAYFSIGGKYAYRLGQVSLDREDPDFFDNDAHLFIVRGDYRFLKDWEGSLEGRMLDLPDLDERRTGALFTVYRYLGENLKLGVGYNFTDFSEDLTDLSYDHHGLFFNLVGTL